MLNLSLESGDVVWYKDCYKTVLPEVLKYIIHIYIYIYIFIHLVLYATVFQTEVQLLTTSHKAYKGLVFKSINAKIVVECVRKIKNISEVNALVWVPGYSGMRGLADKLARVGASLPTLY